MSIKRNGCEKCGEIEVTLHVHVLHNLLLSQGAEGSIDIFHQSLIFCNPTKGFQASEITVLRAKEVKYFVRVRIRGLEMFVFSENLTCFVFLKYPF